MISIGVAGLVSLLLSQNPAPTVACAQAPSMGRRVRAPRSIGRPVYGRDLGLAPGEVVLTFDDGPDRTATPTALSELNAGCVKATFFIVGRSVGFSSETPAKVLAQGHTIGSHTLSHLNLSEIPLPIARKEILEGAASVDRATGGRRILFRFPFAAQTGALQQAVDKLGLVAIGVDVESNDWDKKTRCTDNVQMITSALTAKRSGIIVMHDTYPDIGCEVRGILRYLHDKNYKVLQLMP